MRHIFKKRFSISGVVGLLVFVIIGVAIYAYAVTTVPYTFTSGTVAKSSEVNTNFQALANAIDTISLTPGPQGPTGPTGPQGPQGPAGSPDSADQVRDKFFTGSSCVGNGSDDIMVKVGPLCVDKYEASVWTSLTGGAQITGPLPCGENGNDCKDANSIFARSVAGVTPRTSITWFQAQQACALSGKRLLTNAEWQMAAAGTPDGPPCKVDSSPGATGTAGCTSNWGVYDMVGNLPEWVADWVQGNTNPWFPSSATSDSSITNATYGNDWMSGINPATIQGGGLGFLAALVRGGGSEFGTGPGVFALRVAYAPSNSDGSIGFRCAR